jgi:hypothetical protein
MGEPDGQQIVDMALLTSARRSIKPMPPMPTIIRTQVRGSGDAEMGVPPPVELANT